MLCGGVCHFYLCASNLMGIWPTWWCWKHDHAPLSLTLVVSLVVSAAFHAAETSSLHGLQGVPIFRELPLWFLTMVDRITAVAIVLQVISQHFYWSRERMVAWLHAEPLLPIVAAGCWIMGEVLGCHLFNAMGLAPEIWCPLGPFHYTIFHCVYHIMAYMSVLRALQHAHTTHPTPPKRSTKMV